MVELNPPMMLKKNKITKERPLPKWARGNVKPVKIDWSKEWAWLKKQLIITRDFIFMYKPKNKKDERAHWIELTIVGALLLISYFGTKGIDPTEIILALVLTWTFAKK